MKYFSLYTLLIVILFPVSLPAQPVTHLLADAETALRQLSGFSYSVTLTTTTDHFASPDTHTGRVTFERKAPRDYPYRFRLESPDQRVVYDGQRVAWRDLDNGMESSIVAQAFRTDCGVPWTIRTQPLLRITWPELADRLRTWRTSPTATIQVAKEMVAGERCLHITVDEVSPGGERERYELWLAVATRLPVRYASEREDACGSATLTADFDDIVVNKSETR